MDKIKICIYYSAAIFLLWMFLFPAQILTKDVWLWIYGGLVISWFFAIIFFLIFFVKEIQMKEIYEIESLPPRVKIVRCSSPFYWYAKIAEIKDKDKQDEKIFFVEKDLTSDGLYRTSDDVCGPNVKGFINPQDVEGGTYYDN